MGSGPDFGGIQVLVLPTSPSSDLTEWKEAEIHYDVHPRVGQSWDEDKRGERALRNCCWPFSCTASGFQGEAKGGNEVGAFLSQSQDLLTFFLHPPPPPIKTRLSLKILRLNSKTFSPSTTPSSSRRFSPQLQHSNTILHYYKLQGLLAGFLEEDVWRSTFIAKMLISKPILSLWPRKDIIGRRMEKRVISCWCKTFIWSLV